MNRLPTNVFNIGPWIRGWVSRGFTLVEVVLSLALCVVLVGLLATATQMFLMNLELERDELTRARAARAVLQLMAFDLRAAVQHKEIDESALDQSLEAASSMLEEEDEEAGNIPPEGLFVEQPGLKGNDFSISFDISRLPRRDQFQPALDPRSGQVMSVPSEILNVNYMVGTVDEPSPGGESAGPRMGLLRMEYDRAAKRYADQGGGQMPGYELIAEEVRQLNFRYFDGASWFDTWDTNEMRTLPVAIEISLMVDPRSPEFRRMQQAAGDTDALFALQRFVTIVHLPIAESVAVMRAREEMKLYVE